MAPKKSQRSALYFYALEAIQERGVKGPIMNAIESVYTEWKALSSVEKLPYERQYQDWKENLQKERKVDIYSCPMLKTEVCANSEHAGASQVDRGVRILEQLGQIMASSSPNASGNEAATKGAIKHKEKTKKIIFDQESVANQPWYVIKFQTFCKASENPIPNFNHLPYFVLAEVAIVKYSVQEGIQDEYHAFIKPNPVPLGFRSRCMDSERDVHKIPLSGELAHESVQEIYKNIYKFLGEPKNEHELPPLFSMANEDVRETEFGMSYLQHMYFAGSGEAGIKTIPALDYSVFDLEYLVVFLAGQRNVDITCFSAHDMLTQYCYDYSSSSWCAYHEEKGENHCALGYCKRYCFLISDHLCEMYSVELTERHVPVEKQVGTVIQAPGHALGKFNRTSSSVSVSARGSGGGGKRSYYRDDESSVAGNNNNNNEEPFDNMSQVSSTRIYGSVDIRGGVSAKGGAVSSSSSATVSSFRTIENIHAQQQHQQQQQAQPTSSGSPQKRSSSSSQQTASAPQACNPDADHMTHESKKPNLQQPAYQFENANENVAEEDDDDNGWTTVTTKHASGATTVDKTDTQSVRSDSTTFTKSSKVSSSTKSFMGRGRSLAKK